MTGKQTTKAILPQGSREYWERKGLFPDARDRSFPGLRLRRFLEDCLARGFRPARLFRFRQAARAENRELHQLSLYQAGENPLTGDLVIRGADGCFEPGSGQQFFEFRNGPEPRARLTRLPDDPALSLDRLFGDDPSAEELEKRLESYVNEHPLSKEALIELGNLRFSREDLEGAAELYRRCLEIDPDCAEACYNLAGCHVRKSEYAAAIRLYHRSVRLRPDFPEALYSLGVLYLTLNYAGHARPLLQAVVALGAEEWAIPAKRFLHELDQPVLDPKVLSGDTLL